MNQSLSRTIAGIQQNQFLVLGRVGMDLYPDPPGTASEDATDLKVAVGGSSANIAIGIVKLGGAAALVTRVSNDSVGRYCVKQLNNYGVDATQVRQVSGPGASEYRNSLALYETRVEGHQSVIYRNGAADFQMSIDDVEQIDYSQYGALITAGTVFAAEPSRSATFRAFDLARDAGIPIIFDIDYRPYSWPNAEEASMVLSRAGKLSNVIIGNDEEFGFMAGGIDKGLAKARELASNTAALIIYKMGGDGAISFTNDEEIRTGIYPVEAVKPTGAGDSFMAGLMASLAANKSLHESILRGSACAAIVVAKPGCAPAMPNIAELEQFLSSHPGHTAVN
ncbi:MAG: 5-dehydro-2-deoxygluconokinase [Granulosicoccaceae bacterium]